MMYYHEGNGMNDTAPYGWVAATLGRLDEANTPPWTDARPESERTGTMSIALEEEREHTSNGTANCRWPVHCAFCGEGLYQWYLCLRAPMCAACHGKSGPLRAPASWELCPQRCSPAARQVWESWAAHSEAFPASSEDR